MRIFFRFTLILLTSSSFQSYSQKLSEGSWQGIIHYETVDIPFTFLVNYTSSQFVKISFQNGENGFVIENVGIINDSIRIPMLVFDAEIRAFITKDKMEGEWHKNYKESKGPRFSAFFNLPRFANENVKTKLKIKNKWDLTFLQPSGQTSKAVGLFRQEGNILTGTIMTEVGDFRYFTGVLFGDSLRVSSFDGAHGFLMLGKHSDGKWRGDFHYEDGYSEKWTAFPNAEASLPNPFSLITVEPETHKPYYDILTAGGEYNAIDTEQLEDKVVIIQLMGTWCPNSLDQTKYLTEWYKKQNPDKIELIAVTYEPGDKTYSKQRIESYSKMLNIHYPMYIGGTMSKGQAALAFPNMGKINAFPTLVLIDKQGYIRHINSYFNGPATGAYYIKFNTDFNDLVNKLLKE